MRVICSYCRKEIGQKPPVYDRSVSHGMCPRCKEHFEKQWQGLDLSEYLDHEFGFPVVLVDEAGRFIAANKAMAEMLGKSGTGYQGFLGGEAMECQFARLPGGCGKTLHCKTCTVRRTIGAARDTGRPQLEVPAFIDQEDQRLELLISAYPEDRFVRVVIESASASPVLA